MSRLCFVLHLDCLLNQGSYVQHVQSEQCRQVCQLGLGLLLIDHLLDMLLWFFTLPHACCTLLRLEHSAGSQCTILCSDGAGDILIASVFAT